MIRQRSRMERKDRDCGLVFAWRLPVSSSMSMLTALAVVGLIAAAVGSLVRLRIGEKPREELRPGSLMLVPGEGGGRSLEWIAIEAGPFPARWNPAADPEYAALRGAALKQAGEGLFPYEPILEQLSPVKTGGEWMEKFGATVMPPLPEATMSGARAGELASSLGIRVLRSGAGAELQLPEMPLEGGEVTGSVGRRFLVAYGVEGRVLEVTALDSTGSPLNLEGWLRRAKVVAGDAGGGSLVVETLIAP